MFGTRGNAFSLNLEQSFFCCNDDLGERARDGSEASPACIKIQSKAVYMELQSRCGSFLICYFVFIAILNQTLSVLANCGEPSLFTLPFSLFAFIVERKEEMAMLDKMLNVFLFTSVCGAGPKADHQTAVC